MDDTHCMNPTCKRPWTIDFQDRIFPMSFRTGPWKDHRELILVDRERTSVASSRLLVTDWMVAGVDPVK
jgi:hypothetical protein